MTLQAGPYLPRAMPPPLAGLVRLALDLRWSWQHGSDILWRTVNAQVWDGMPNAWLVLNTVSDERLEELAADPEFLALLDAQLEAQAAHDRAETWFSSGYQGPALGSVAFFCMEYALTEYLPIYSGGLGVLAGDLLKAASDLGVPIIGLGLLYQQGYFRQSINAEGEQLELYPYNDPTMLPLSPLRDSRGEWVRVIVDLPGRPLRLRAWRGQVGRCQLLLLDSNDPRNEPADRGITSELYGGGEEKRLQQELALGIGGWRLLDQLGIECQVCHLNEGHSAFAVLERIRCHRAKTGQSFAAARIAVRAGTLFTTHTPVAAGFDRFRADMIRLYLGEMAAQLDLSPEDLLALGQEEDGPADSPFNMAYLAIRLAGAVNAVSQLHQRVSQRLFQPLFPRRPGAEVPIAAVTNGVHTPSWDSPEADALWTRACGKERWRGTLQELDEPLRAVDDRALWQLRSDQRTRLVAFLRHRLSHQHFERVNRGPEGAAYGALLDDEILTLGFARRFTEYKRPDLLLHDPERLVRLLNDRDRPVQLVIAGKAHPRDWHGKEMVQAWHRFIRRPDVIGRVVFIEDYDLQVATSFVQGVDVWLNTPRWPWEACGTSGMKVLVNGGLNLSQYDGWWAEAYDPAWGWAMGMGRQAGMVFSESGPGSDREDAMELYRCLEEEVIPRFYEADHQGLPSRWIAMMRRSMAQLTPRFSANRMVREYTECFYGPLFDAAVQRNPAWALEIEQWQRALGTSWRHIRFGNVEAASEGDEHRFNVQVHLNGVSADSVSVELYAEGGPGRGKAVVPLHRGEELAGAHNAFNYYGSAPADRPADHYTPRVVAVHPLLRTPLELDYIVWYR